MSDPTIKDILMQASDSQMDASMKPLIQKWSEPEPTPLQVLEVLDHCIFGGLASGFVVTALQSIYDTRCKETGTAHEAVEKLAAWRQTL